MCGEKACTKCGKSKPLSEFGKNAASADGLRPDCKACKNAVGAQYYQANREKILAHQIEYGRENRVARAEYGRDWYRRNKSRKLAKSRAWKKANAEHYANQQREYVEANREASNARQRKWAKANPEKRRSIMRHHNLQRRLKLSSGVSASALTKWVNEQDPICFYCGKDCSDGSFEIDHFHPLAKGGAHELENLRIACQPCNRRKSARDPHEFIESLAA